MLYDGLRKVVFCCMSDCAKRGRHMRHKKWFFVLFIIQLAVFAGCGSGNVDTSSGTSAPNTPPAAATGFATLAWNAPATNTDGTALTDLAGYKIYYGTSSGHYTQSVNVGNTTSFTINNLASGHTYYFAVTAYDSAGLESGYSAEASKNL
jgi:ABC-type oligopeptide transport system substrate-binding subunit